MAGTRTGMLVVGVGNEYRCDDAAGLLVVRMARGRLGGAATVVECCDDVSALVDLLGRAEAAVIVDAVCSGAPAGTVRRLDAAAGPLPTEYFRFSSHAFGVAEAVELARTLGLLPRRAVLVGIEGGDFSAGERLGAPVEAALPAAVLQVLMECGRA